MKKSFIYTLLIFLSLSCLSLSEILAQPFFGHQAPRGLHTFFFSINYDGQTSLGLGYVLRDVNPNTFTDYSAEWRFPVNEAFQAKNSSFVVGLYRPAVLNSRPFIGLGAHARIDKKTEGGESKTEYGLMLSGVPSYTFGNSGAESLNGTFGTRLSFIGVLAETTSGTPQAELFPRFKFELAGHLDLHVERTISTSMNGIIGTHFNLKSDEESDSESSFYRGRNLYFGTTYNLRRL